MNWLGGIFWSFVANVNVVVNVVVVTYIYIIYIKCFCGFAVFCIIKEKMTKEKHF